MKKGLIITLMLSGCSYSTSGGSLELAFSYCKDKGGIDYINHFIDNTVWCRDGSRAQVPLLKASNHK